MPMNLSRYPQSVSMRQARLALHAAPNPANPAQTLLDAVNAAIASDTTGVLPIWWEYSQTIQRNNPLMLQVATTLGLTSDQIDALFVAASKL